MRIGRRVSRQGKSAGSTGYTKYVFDGLDVVMDIDGGTLTKYQNGPGIDNKLSLKTGSDVKYFLQDHLGSTVGLTDTTRSITASQSYDSFGNGTNTSFPTRYQFTGREFDSFTGLQFSRARWYDPNLGRFISEDPIGFAGGDINLYGYVWNNPMHFTDPMGLSPWSDWAAWANEGRWRGEQAVINFFAPLFEGAIGFGDNASFGASRWFRQWQGFDDSYLDCSFAFQAGGWAGLAVDAATGIGGAAKLGLKFAAKRGAKTRFPKSPERMDDRLGVPGRRIPDGPGTPGRNKVEWKPSDKVKITYEQHPYHPTAPKWHRNPHWHVQWPGQRHTRYLPGDKFPGL
ncbi:RHS repeat-associated core domain-containing protein [Leptolyngbya sp. 7M]|uniref:RHS repeat-associated core domain-containing protein n=1 Tax=Leptolyngbya sp. 7M TaxID=2812896 RepID=UPI001B8BD6FF|nr:RHS repeat-associated core domain-containing protein [Leptolyngbya sp. 7M]QYO65715.1 RHS repeat-associated core domain-containing protein [Leptolyngbya sp. 7M]